MKTVGRWNCTVVLHVCHTRQGQCYAAQCLYNDLSFIYENKSNFTYIFIGFFVGVCVLYT